MASVKKDDEVKENENVTTQEDENVTENIEEQKEGTDANVSSNVETSEVSKKEKENDNKNVEVKKTDKLIVKTSFRDKYTNDVYDEKDVLQINEEYKDIKAKKIKEHLYEISKERAEQLKKTEYVD